MKIPSQAAGRHEGQVFKVTLIATFLFGMLYIYLYILNQKVYFIRFAEFPWWTELKQSQNMYSKKMLSIHAENYFSFQTI